MWPMTERTALYNLVDCEPDMAVVRAKDDDDAFWSLAADHIREHQWMYPLPDLTDPTGGQWLKWAKAIIRPPVWRWYRWNVLGRDRADFYGYAFMLGSPTGPGRGNWRGAVVQLKPHEERTRLDLSS
jgi:hypothetical protein